jgi:hypothetical protein
MFMMMLPVKRNRRRLCRQRKLRRQPSGKGKYRSRTAEELA